MTGSSARVWPSCGPGAQYPERSHPFVDPPLLTGVCFSGGSTRAYAATVGHLRGLTETGLISKVGYMSAVSGGAWAATPYAYYAGGAVTDGEILGPYEEPESLSPARLDRMDSDTLGYAATLDFRGAVAAAQSSAAITPDRIWSHAVGQTFLAPFGLFDLGDTTGFTLDDLTARDIHERNPSVGGLDLRTIWSRSHRPYLLVHSALNWPPDESDVFRSERIGFEYAPLAIGTPATHRLRSANGRLHTVGGFVEPFAFGGAPPGVAVDSDVVEMGRPYRAFTLADVVGASSAFSTPDRDLRRYPQADCWPVGSTDAEPPRTTRHVFTDGGDLENYGLIPLLGRGVRAVVVFINTVWPLALDYDPTTWPKDLDEAAPSRRRLDPFLAPLFGAPSSRFPHNRVFDPDDYPSVVYGLQAAKRRGETVMTVTTHTVIPNEWWGLEGGQKVKICWIYNERVDQWTNRLPDTLRAQVREGEAADPGGPFSHFPHYLTQGQNPGALIRLTSQQTNLMAHLSSWNVVSNLNALRAVLG